MTSEQELIGKIKEQLTQLEKEKGGYTGQDIDKIAETIDRSYWYVWRRLRGKIADKEFLQFTYLGRTKGSLNQEEIETIRHWLSDNCLHLGVHILHELNDKRRLLKEPLISRRTFYRTFSKVYSDLDIDENDPFCWLIQRGISVLPEYSLEDARRSLKTTFTLADLANKSFEDLKKIVLRLKMCLKWMDTHYFSVDIPEYVNDLNLRRRKNAIPFQLSSIHLDESPAIQVRLIFETQISTIIEFYDFICYQLALRSGRIDQQIKKEMAKTKNKIWEKRQSHGQQKQGWKNKLSVTDEAYLELLMRHGRSYQKLYTIISEFTDKFSSAHFFVYDSKAHRLVEALRVGSDFDPSKMSLKGLINQSFLIPQITKKWGIRRALLTRLFIRYLKDGRVTVSTSFYYQNIGKLIEQSGNSGLKENPLKEGITALINGNYPIKKEWFMPFQLKTEEETDDEELPPLPMVNYSDVAIVASELITNHNTDWYDEHVQLFKEMTDYMFEFTYSHDEFRKQLTHAIGFFGRNLRFRDDDNFMSGKYFFDRYINSEVFYLEHKFLFKTAQIYWPFDDYIVVVDTKGDLGRKLSVLTFFHGRYLMVGYSDLRGAFPSQFPCYSHEIYCQDSEAMNLCPLIGHLINTLKSNLKAQTGDCHTTSKCSRSLIFLGYDVIGAGRFIGKGHKVSSNEKRLLMSSCDVLYNIGELIHRSSDYGRVIAGKKFVYVHGKNVIRRLDALGDLIQNAVMRVNPDINRLCNIIESTNFQKRLVRFHERGRIRLSHRRVSIGLEGGELMLCNIFLYNAYKHKDELKRKGISPMTIQHVRLFGPK